MSGSASAVAVPPTAADTAPYHLDDFALRPQNNNLTAVRFVLASGVIFTHSFWRQTGIESSDWLSGWLGAPISLYAVDGFFFLSGFLVYRSLLRQPTLGRFMLARLARMFPALLASVVLTAAIGYAFTQAPAAAYWRGETARFLIGNLTFLKGYYTLTGVRCGGAELCNVNGSLWTLPWEMRCYIALAVLSLIGLAIPRRMIRIVVPATIVFAAAWQFAEVRALATGVVSEGLAAWLDQIARLWTLFAAGCAALAWRDRIVLDWRILVALLVLNCVTMLNGVGFPAHVTFVGYAVLYFGFRRTTLTPAFAALPDYSYGIYIYAFPIMALIAAALPGLSAIALALLNLAAVLPVAALSWHLLEKPALDRVKRKRRAPLAEPAAGPA